MTWHLTGRWFHAVGLSRGPSLGTLVVVRITVYLVNSANWPMVFRVSRISKVFKAFKVSKVFKVFRQVVNSANEPRQSS